MTGAAVRREGVNFRAIYRSIFPSDIFVAGRRGISERGGFHDITRLSARHVFPTGRIGLIPRAFSSH